MAATTPEPRPSERLTKHARAGLHGTAKVFAGFKEFISRGNAVELAVGVVVGAAFGAIVSSLQNYFISPLIGWVFGQPNLTDLWDIGPYSWRPSTPQDPISPIKVGAILNALIQFLITAAAIYFLIVLRLNAFARRRARGEEPVPEAPAEDVELLREIRDLLAAQAAGGSGTGPTTPAQPSTWPASPVRRAVPGQAVVVRVGGGRAPAEVFVVGRTGRLRPGRRALRGHAPRDVVGRGRGQRRAEVRLVAADRPRRAHGAPAARALLLGHRFRLGPPDGHTRRLRRARA